VYGPSKEGPDAVPRALLGTLNPGSRPALARVYN
jgi:hypothetical protein